METSTKQILFFIIMGIFYSIFYIVTSLIGGNIKTIDGKWNKSTLLIVFISTIFFALLTFGYTEITGLFNEKYNRYTPRKIRESPVKPIPIKPIPVNPIPVKPTPPEVCKQQINPRFCRGGAYTWQGDSHRAKSCRELASTPEGLAQIRRYECGAGFTGMPGCGFRFTPMSDGNWKNQRCDSPSGCNVEDNGIF